MELLQLRYFATVAKYQNITKAAEEHAIPQPAMSKTISNLERELGVQLFERYGNRIVLNRQGEQFYDAVWETLHTLDSSILELHTRNNMPAGEIKLLILQNRNAIIDLIADFSNTYPNIKFTIYHSNVYSQDFDFDFCLASELFWKENLKKTLVFTEEIMLAVHQNHPLAEKGSVKLNELQNEKFVSMPEFSELGAVTLKACRKHNFVPDISILCDDPFYVRKYVSLGMGVAFAPSVAWANLWPDNILFLPIHDAGFARSTYLYAQGRQEKSKEYAIFQHYLLTRMRNS